MATARGSAADATGLRKLKENLSVVVVTALYRCFQVFLFLIVYKNVAAALLCICGSVKLALLLL